MLPSTWIQSGFRYGLSYLTALVTCTIMIVIGNDLLIHSTHRGLLSDAILEIGYRQWLRLSALSLALSFALYLILFRLFLQRLPVAVSALCCGLISAGVAFCSGIGHGISWYELKNLLTFFIAGVAFGSFSRLLN